MSDRHAQRRMLQEMISPVMEGMAMVMMSELKTILPPGEFTFHVTVHENVTGVVTSVTDMEDDGVKKLLDFMSLSFDEGSIEVSGINERTVN